MTERIDELRFIHPEVFRNSRYICIREAHIAFPSATRSTALARVNDTRGRIRHGIHEHDLSDFPRLVQSFGDVRWPYVYRLSRSFDGCSPTLIIHV